MDIKKTQSELISQLRFIVADEENSNSRRERALRTLLKYNKDSAVAFLNEFIDNGDVWAIEVGLKLLREDDSEISGLGDYYDDK